MVEDKHTVGVEEGHTVALREGERVVDGERVREVAPDMVRESAGVGVEEGGKVVVEQMVPEVEKVGETLLDDEPLGLHVGWNTKPVVGHASQVQGMGVERPGVGQ
jgi:hypothetical protein